MPPKTIKLPNEQVQPKQKLPAVYFGKLSDDFCIFVLLMRRQYYEKLRKSDANNPTSVGNTWNDIYTVECEPQLQTFKGSETNQWKHRGALLSKVCGYLKKAYKKFISNRKTKSGVAAKSVTFAYEEYARLAFADDPDIECESATTIGFPTIVKQQENSIPIPFAKLTDKVDMNQATEYSYDPNDFLNFGFGESTSFSTDMSNVSNTEKPFKDIIPEEEVDIHEKKSFYAEKTAEKRKKAEARLELKKNQKKKEKDQIPKSLKSGIKTGKSIRSFIY